MTPLQAKSLALLDFVGIVIALWVGYVGLVLLYKALQSTLRGPRR